MALVVAGVLAVATGALVVSRRDSHRNDDVLSLSAGGGGFSADPLDHFPYHLTFGSLVLCKKRPDVKVEIQRVRYESNVSALNVKPVLRQFIPADLEGPSAPDSRLFEPNVVIAGEPPNFAENDHGLSLPGHYRFDVQGFEVAQTCDETKAANVALETGEAPADGFTELMFVVEAGKQGASIDKVFVDYLADGEPQTATSDWQMIACGSAIPKRMMCAAGPSKQPSRSGR